MRSKYTILQERLSYHSKASYDISETLKGLDTTPCGYPCSGCGTMLVSEGDFARHFSVSKMDEMNNHLNLGSCPNKDYS